MASAAQHTITFGTKIIKVLQAGLLTTSGLALVASGGWVMYKDAYRWPRMESTFSSGHIIPPMDKDLSQVKYFHRPDLEKILKATFSPVQSGQYYVVHGQVGSGKSRVVVELVQDMIRSDGRAGRGAPIYVNATQGVTFIDALAKAVNFHFDEHINFNYFIDFLFRVTTAKGQDEHHRLSRVLDAIEEAGRRYAYNKGRPLVLVIDGVDYLSEHVPSYVERIQAKAKLWADAGIAKVVFVTSEEKSRSILEKCHTSWSRADIPTVIGDLDRLEAILLLQQDLTPEGTGKDIMNNKEAQFVFDLVGGRVKDLITFKRDYAAGVPLHVTSTRLLNKERDKFVHVAGDKNAVAALKKLRESKTHSLPLDEFAAIAGEEGLKLLVKHNIILLQREKFEMLVQFQSRLTENTVNEFHSRRQYKFLF